ncbi:hypothetical protein EDD86DRAFT_199641 [Gorgonomyces haynaldii]|nr:hypothetical protein EDD86DRAFT_199641 [Gorgonomyces haynaldii]
MQQEAQKTNLVNGEKIKSLESRLVEVSDTCAQYRQLCHQLQKDKQQTDHELLGVKERNQKLSLDLGKKEQERMEALQLVERMQQYIERLERELKRKEKKIQESELKQSQMRQVQMREQQMREQEIMNEMLTVQMREQQMREQQLREQGLMGSLLDQKEDLTFIQQDRIESEEIFKQMDRHIELFENDQSQ